MFLNVLILDGIVFNFRSKACEWSRDLLRIEWSWWILEHWSKRYLEHFVCKFKKIFKKKIKRKFKPAFKVIFRTYLILLGSYALTLIQPWSRINVTSRLNICKLVRKT